MWMANVNVYRGEVAVKVGDAEIVLVPSFARLAALEAALGKSLIDLAQMFVEETPTLEQMRLALAVAAGVSDDAVDGDGVVGENYLAVRMALAKFFAAAVGVSAEA